MLQIHPENLQWRQRIAASGTEIEKKMFERYQMPWCGDNPSPGCTALADAPPKAVGHGLWPPDFSDEEFDTIGGLVIQAFGHMPTRNEVATIDNFEFKVINADQRKIHSLRMRPLA